MTLPVVLAWRRGDEAEREFWRRTVERSDLREEDLTHAMELMAAHDTLGDTLERARHYGSIARDALGIFPQSEIKDAMLEVVDFVIDRAY